MHQKVFRAEKLLVRKHAAVPAANDSAVRHAELLDQIKALRAISAHRNDGRADDMQRLKRELDLANDTIDRSRQDLSVLLRTKNDEPRLARASEELGATIDGMEAATESILKAAEVIDESAKALLTIVKNEYEKGLAQEVQEQVVRVYEACNFQDLAGQRIQKAMATLKFIEERVTAMMQTCGDLEQPPRPVSPRPSLGRQLANGPKLDGDDGHASQQDIDLMFG
ncbi:MAG TPA: protein phosphatase CheZ [Pseudolabrys sp.]|nr:protein phosphatase CheZ [Pseudolabrys sp.]